MKKLIVFAALVALIFSFAQSASAQSGEELKAIKKEIEALKKGQAAIQKDLQEIKNLLRAGQTPPPDKPQEAVLNVEGAHFKGVKNAKVTIIDFSDYQ